MKRGESSKTKAKDKGKAKVEEVDAMGGKRAMYEESSQEKEKGESSRKPTKPWCKIRTSNFAMTGSSNPHNLVHNVFKQGSKINWSKLLHLALKVR